MWQNDGQIHPFSLRPDLLWPKLAPISITIPTSKCHRCHDHNGLYLDSHPTLCQFLCTWRFLLNGCVTGYCQAMWANWVYGQYEWYGLQSSLHWWPCSMLPPPSPSVDVRLLQQHGYVPAVHVSVWTTIHNWLRASRKVNLYIMITIFHPGTTSLLQLLHLMAFYYLDQHRQCPDVKGKIWFQNEGANCWTSILERSEWMKAGQRKLVVSVIETVWCR